ncbi:MAG: chitobiase/beta-hexosaminidase C-terminal domain-containing protein, partial [Paramuribaculum sp.]|nr:chitobiase/beta-hexosaminidase C-terminal domain-containing protein [Paramuribaculum sp.]
ATSTVERIRFIKEEAIEIASIKDFKPLYQSGGNSVAGADYNNYYVIKGEVVIEDAASSNFLLRDNVPESSDPEIGQRYHLLVYNENGWSQPEVSVIENGVRVSRPLKGGDVISSFVVRPELTSYNLFRGNATGFARTYTINPGVEPTKESERTVILSYDPKDAESGNYYEKIYLEPKNILMPFKFENVAIGCRENPEYETAAERPDGTRIDGNGNPVPQYIYQMVVRDCLDIDFLTFPDRVGGFTTSYDMDKFKAANGDVTKYPTYDINAVVIKNPYYDGKDNGASQYAMALTDFGGVMVTEAPAAMYVVGFEDKELNENGEFEYPHDGVVKIIGIPEGGSVYYTLDGSDPKNSLSPLKYDDNTGIKLPADNISVTIRAYSVKPGELPSKEISQIFRRQSVDVPYLLHFFNVAKKDVPYHFSGICRIAEKDGDHIFVRGSEGYMLTIHRNREVQPFAANRQTDMWDSYKVGDYLTDFIITADMFDENEFERTAEITDEHAQYLKASLTEKPAALSEDINIDRYAIAKNVSRIHDSHIGQLVVLNHVKLIQIGDKNSWQYMIVPDYGNAVEEAMLVNDATLSFNMPENLDVEHNYFNVLGYVMVDDEAEQEFWPLEISTFGITNSPAIECDANAIIEEDGFNNYTVDFYPSTVVTLKYTGMNAASASLKYIFTPDGGSVDENATWNIYGQPFTVTADGYLHVVAVVDGMEESGHTHVTFRRTEQSCDVDFVVVPFGNQSKVTLLPVSDIDEGSYKILYSTDGTEPATEYTDPIVIDKTTTFIARMYEDGKAPGNACRGMFNAGSGNSVSSQVIFSIVKDNDGNPLVQLSPREAIEPGTYSIYYTTSVNEIPTVSKDMLYTKPFPVPESRVVLAILVINRKVDGGVTTLNVWDTTAISAIGSDNSEVRVEGGCIIAPEGSQIYNTAGIKVGKENLPKGIYIVRIPGKKSIKVIVK